jgi:lipopolysaccharide transport system ATP-binding protein
MYNHSNLDLLPSFIYSNMLIFFMLVNRFSIASLRCTSDLTAIQLVSMAPSVISVENLSKRYLVGHRDERAGEYRYTALRDVLNREFSNFARKAVDVARGRQVVQGDTVEEYWALKNVSFEVRQGEVLGIIGRNGAGKSTLLKILSRIIEPTSGRVTLRGRVASLLEVGTGFHPELSGRENIYLNGSILGMSRAEVRKKFDEIVAFAEVERFLDTPVKRYSSGMYVRLAFAVAAHLEPEILVIDEVLAVGDADFQKKCLGKMDEASRRDGRTVLFVSHNMGILTSLCPAAIWLERGTIRERGPVRDLISDYLSRHIEREQIIHLAEVPRPHMIDDNRLRLESLEWLCDLPLRHGEPLTARIRFRTRAPVSAATVGIGFSSIEGTRLLTYETDFQTGFRPDLSCPGDYVVDVTVGELPLAPDTYNLDVGCRSGDSHALDVLAGCAQIEVIGGPRTPGYIVVKGAGVRLTSDWCWEQGTQGTQPGTHLLAATTDG